MAGVEQSKIPLNQTVVEREVGKESYISLSEVFEIVYPGLDPQIFELTQTILAKELERLKEKGIKATWVRSGARRLAVYLAQNLDNIDDLRSKWGIFRPELSNRPEVVRKRLASFRQTVNGMDEYRRSKLDPLVERIFCDSDFGELLDMDIKIGTDGSTEGISVDEEILHFTDDSRQNQSEGGNTDMQDENITAEYTRNSQTIFCRKNTGLIPNTQKYNACLNFLKNKQTLFSMQIGTMPQTAQGAFKDFRNSTTAHSIDAQPSFPLFVVDEKVMINTSGLQSWSKSLEDKVHLDRSIRIEDSREVLNDLRSGRILCLMYPVSNNLPAMIDSLYEPETLEHIRKSFAQFKDSESVDSPLQADMCRELLAMFEADPYFASVWCIETGAAQMFFGENGEGLLLQTLLSEGMTQQTYTNPTNNIEQKPLPTYLRTPANLHKDREMFLHQPDISGMKLFYDALRDSTMTNSLSIIDLNKIIQLFTAHDKEMREFIGHCPQIQVIKGVKTKFGSSYTQFPGERIGPNATAKDMLYSALFSEIMSHAGEYAQGKWRINVEELQNLLDNSSAAQQLLSEGHPADAQSVADLLVRKNIFTYWNSDIFLTPEQDSKSLIFPRLSGTLETYFGTRAKEILVDILARDKSVAEETASERNTLAQNYLGNVSLYYDNILGLLRNPPSAQAIRDRVLVNS